MKAIHHPTAKSKAVQYSKMPPAEINPLTPELNTSAQRCLTRFLLGILLLELYILFMYA
jgi:hypothetical protein